MPKTVYNNRFYIAPLGIVYVFSIAHIDIQPQAY